MESASLHGCMHAGAYFNRGKILGMLGREGEAQEAYREAALMAEGAAPGSYVKALASLKTFDSALTARMEEAARFLKLAQGARFFTQKAAPFREHVSNVLQGSNKILQHPGSSGDSELEKWAQAWLYQPGTQLVLLAVITAASAHPAISAGRNSLSLCANK